MRQSGTLADTTKLQLARVGERVQDHTDIFLRHVCGACWSQVGLTIIIMLGVVLCLATARPALGSDLCMASLTRLIKLAHVLCTIFKFIYISVSGHAWERGSVVSVGILQLP